MIVKKFEVDPIMNQNENKELVPKYIYIYISFTNDVDLLTLCNTRCNKPVYVILGVSYFAIVST